MCSLRNWISLSPVSRLTDEQTSKTETKRDRVRRLLIDPLTEHGFRKPGDV
ncbi:hypothetical protein HC022_22425, partial [Salipiger sp. HF18]|nr:hypothetical protein [Salipiger sp. HF18]